MEQFRDARVLEEIDIERFAAADVTLLASRSPVVHGRI
jgi:hypothetical protein